MNNSRKPAPVGAIIRVARVALGLTQQDVAARLGTKGASGLPLGKRPELPEWSGTWWRSGGVRPPGELVGATPPTEQQVVGNGSPVLDPDARQARRPPRPGIDTRIAQLSTAPGRVAPALVRADSGDPLAGHFASPAAPPEALTPDAIRRAIQETEELAKNSSRSARAGAKHEATRGGLRWFYESVLAAGLSRVRARQRWTMGSVVPTHRTVDAANYDDTPAAAHEAAALRPPARMRTRRPLRLPARRAGAAHRPTRTSDACQTAAKIAAAPRPSSETHRAADREQRDAPAVTLAVTAKRGCGALLRRGARLPAPARGRAFRPIAESCSGVRVSARRLPPILPPLRPSATAAAFLRLATPEYTVSGQGRGPKNSLDYA